MTNATVAESVAGNDGHTLLIKYKDGEKKVVVSPDTPVVTYVPADKSELKAGAKVIAFFKKLPDGSFEANRVSVGRADAADVIRRRCSRGTAPRGVGIASGFAVFCRLPEQALGGKSHAENRFVDAARCWRR